MLDWSTTLSRHSTPAWGRAFTNCTQCLGLGLSGSVKPPFLITSGGDSMPPTLRQQCPRTLPPPLQSQCIPPPHLPLPYPPPAPLLLPPAASQLQTHNPWT